MLRRRARGFSLMTAIFLLVVVAVLGAYIASLATTQQTSQALDVQGARAYQAAYAGIQWGVYQTLRNSACTGTSIALGGTLAGFSVTVDCTPTPYTEGGVARTIYRIVATGCSPPNIGTACPGIPGAYYVERQLEATVDR